MYKSKQDSKRRAELAELVEGAAGVGAAEELLPEAVADVTVCEEPVVSELEASAERT